MILTALLAIALEGHAQTMTQASCRGLLVEAHRGGRPYAENTLPAIEQAARLGFDRAEIDIQKLRDGIWVLHHDAVTGRAVRTQRLAPVMDLGQSDWKNAAALRENGVPDGRPAFLSEALATADKAKIGLNVEIKQPASCETVRTLLSEVAPRTHLITWSTAFPEVARCLAAEKVPYLGLVVGPPNGGQKSEDADRRVRDLLRRTGKQADYDELRRQAHSEYDRVSNRIYLTPEGLQETSIMLHGAGIAALHIPASDLIANPALRQEAAKHGQRISVYSDQGEDMLARWIKATKAADLPYAVIIDGDRNAFCARV